MPDPTRPLPCLSCGRSEARLTTGREVYANRPDLHEKPIWRCACGAYCGCHPGTTDPLGYPADKATRRARMKLHNLRLDPLWKAAPKGKKQKARGAIYRLLGERMGLHREQVHTGMFSIEQCRAAWRALEGVTTEELLAKAKESTNA